MRMSNNKPEVNVIRMSREKYAGREKSRATRATGSISLSRFVLSNSSHASDTLGCSACIVARSPTQDFDRYFLARARVIREERRKKIKRGTIRSRLITQ